ncbi:adhesion G protein-coupled receptor G3 [Suncus etruscus]|uniref:adhesion G protein-coupled receptor G3 n=1 Tax=Suncus etruscus TaxID=109475 RepID=UPI002110BB40|nr:adhesion G protein-coupled receptor G3 [Suncus etruscus]
MATLRPREPHLLLLLLLGISGSSDLLGTFLTGHDLRRGCKWLHFPPAAQWVGSTGQGPYTSLDPCRASETWSFRAWARRVQWHLGMKSFADASEEEPRKPCKGLINKDHYDLFSINDTAECFSKCRAGSLESCNPGNLQRYWLDLERFLVENVTKLWNTSVVQSDVVKALVQNVSTSVPEDLHFSLTPSEVPKQIMGAQQPSDRVRLPRSLFKSLQGHGRKVRLAITTLNIGSGEIFKGPQLSQEDGSFVLNKRLVGLSLSLKPVHRLPEPLEITFSHPPQPKNMTSICVFWDVDEGPAGDWSSRGCSTVRETTKTVCQCDHLTFFTLLVRPILDKATVQALTRISQAGCGTSMVFLAFTIVFYAALRFSGQRLKTEDAPKIHVSLSVSLFLLNLTFFINMGHGASDSSPACKARGAIFHYYLLCTFTWMSLEAFHLYLLVIKVFNTYISHYFLKISLVGWGLPALVVIGTASANSYGRYVICDQDLRVTLELCWFCKTALSALYTTVHGYFIITFLCNAVILGLVAWKIFTLPSATAGKEKSQNWKAVLTMLGLSSLLGMTWGLAVLTPLGLSIIYIFALLNSLQGVFIFCWFLVLYFPHQRSTASSSGTARVDQAQFTSHE